MKKLIILSALFVAGLQTAFCQMGALKGSRTVVSKTFNFKTFDSIQLQDLDGKVEVEVGKTFSIKVSIDDNLEPLLLVEEKNNTLRIVLDKNENNRRYVENSNIKITITVPQLSKISQSGNNETFVKGLQGKSFSIKCSGNANLTVEGNIENLTIEKEGNGDLVAGRLIANIVSVIAMGNGNVKVNASEFFTANGSGNGDIKNIGKAKASANSRKTGNGEIINN